VKQGRRLYGTSLRVTAPGDSLADAKSPLIVLNGGAHDDEMSAGLRALRRDITILFVERAITATRQSLPGAAGPAAAA
jgi:hypothetical protein